MGVLKIRAFFDTTPCRLEYTDVLMKLLPPSLGPMLYRTVGNWLATDTTQYPRTLQCLFNTPVVGDLRSW